MKRSLLVAALLALCSCSDEPSKTIKRLERRLDATIDREYEIGCIVTETTRELAAVRREFDAVKQRDAELLARLERIEVSR